MGTLIVCALAPSFIIATTWATACWGFPYQTLGCFPSILQWPRVLGCVANLQLVRCIIALFIISPQAIARRRTCRKKPVNSGRRMNVGTQIANYRCGP